MGRYKKLNVGDTVFAINIFGKVIEAKIKAINEDDDWLPYELDLETPSRFYARPDLYLNKRAAMVALKKQKFDEMGAALKSAKTANLTMNSEYDKDTHMFTAGNGERVSEYFDLTKDQREELAKFMSKLAEFCHKNTIPLMAVACIAHLPDKKSCFMNSTILPGPRAPDFMWDIDDLLHGMEI